MPNILRRSATSLALIAFGGIVILSPVNPASAVPRTQESRATSPRIVIDTDLSLWWDDATAIGMANVLERQGALRIVGIVSDIRNPEAVPAIDAIDTAYGHPDIPLGAVADTKADTAPHGYSDDLVAKLPHSIRSTSRIPAAVPLLRSLLARQPDHSVTFVAIGAYTNLAGLLRSGSGHGSPLSGRALVARKVKRLVVEDGLFPGGAPPLTNQKLDPSAARVVVRGTNWPTPIAWVDGLTGIQTRVGGSLCTSVPPDNPMRIVYESRFGCGPPGDGDWDGPTLLYAVGGRRNLFSELGRGGAATINDQGGLTWRADPARPHDVYVHVTGQQALDQRIDTLLADT